MRVRTAIADADASSGRRVADDLDYLAACLHGRRSRMAEGDRLTALCRIHSFSEFVRAIFPGLESQEILDFQRRLAAELARELSGFPAHLSGPGAALLNWTLVRFQVENLKVLIRACLTKSSTADPQSYLAPLPSELALDTQGLAAAESLDAFVPLVPKGVLRGSLAEALDIYRDHSRPFFFEAALDHGYFKGLIARAERLSGEDREIITPVVSQEVDIFHLMLIIRGRFHYGLRPEMLLPLHITGTRIPSTLFIEMLNDQDLSVSGGRVAGRVFDGLPFERGSTDGSAAATFDGSSLERLSWKRYLRLANLAFRQSHMGLGAIVGYGGIRRVEVANLITISEGIRKGMSAETIRSRLTTPGDLETTHV
jgi:vacuolar-type H+-ATPase subunit C/Vma6